ncbi:hypothetical protein IKN40_08685 [bacterium]|nr:hypothetical protein [bacterium]
MQQFKAAGVYRVVFDKSTVLNVDSEILRLVVGFSEKGPFNIPVYITNATDFKAYFGDISKKLEKRGIYFHRLALQALGAGPILCLNLKKFDGETVDGATINTAFNPKYEIIENVELAVEDIYNTGRFWELEAEKLNGLKAVDGSVMDQYINICTTNTKETSASYFIRKASGSKVSQYNLTISDWYSDRQDEMPDFLEPFQNSLVSDFFAEIYVFGTKFSASQVLASSTLKKYFEVATDSNDVILTDEDGNSILKLVDHTTNAYGDWVDTLDALYEDETSHAIGHYIGCLIPEFKDKKGTYVSLDVAFNSEIDEHNMMMTFNTDMIYEDETASLDLSGRMSISTNENTEDKNVLNLTNIFSGEAITSLLGNNSAPLISNKVTFINNVVKYNDKSNKYEAVIPLIENSRKVIGTLYVSHCEPETVNTITLRQVGTDDTITITCSAGETAEAKAERWIIAQKLGAAYEANADSEDVTPVIVNGVTKYFKKYKSGCGSFYDETANGDPFIDENGQFIQKGPQKVITSITRIERTTAADYTSSYSDLDKNMKINLLDVVVTMVNDEKESVYGSSVTFIPVSQEWSPTGYNGAAALISEEVYENTIYSILQVGDCLIADDGESEDDKHEDGFYDNVYVQAVDAIYDADGNITKYFVTFSGTPKIFDDLSTNNQYLIRIDNGLNQEIGQMIPQYLEGYTYNHTKPNGSGMYAKLQWQKFILSALTEYKGLRTGLLNKSDIDYRYVVDTFDTFVESSAKSVLSYLCKQKQSAFAILNFPAIKTFVKCPYTSFTNSEDVFDVNYIAAGYNKKKATSVRFSLPSDDEGASFCAFYTPLKFSDGYVDNIIPAAGLVSNLFMQKYTSRQPYYIIAGPNYGKIVANGLIGPDYNYSKEELYVMEPYGVNCMVYRPGFGTFINSNQTAKQTPVSGLSKVNIRELVIYLQDEIEKVLQQYQWEFNNQTTRNAILDKANTICGRVAANGGIEAYLNVMDASNNTDEIIENEMAVISTHIEPGFGCGKMVQELTLYRRGAMTASIKD